MPGSDAEKGWWKKASAGYRERNREKVKAANRARATKWRQDNLDQHRLNAIKYCARKAGYTPATITPEELAKRRAEHSGLCDLCGKKRFLVHDHCHTTGRTRGFVCRPCNRILGVIDDYLLDPTAINEYRK